MSEKIARIKIPWKWFIIGILLELVFVPFFIFYRMQLPGASPYNQSRNSPNFLSDDGFFMATILIGSLIPALIGSRIAPENLSILYTFVHVSYSMIWVSYSMPKLLLFGSDTRWSLYGDWCPFTLPNEQAQIAKLGGVPDYGILIPVLAYWTLLMMLSTFMHHFLAAIWRRQLIDVETLPFPWTVPSVEMIKTVTQTGPVASSNPGKKEVFKEKLLWYGFGAAWLIYVWDILRVLSHGLIPKLPISPMTGGFFVDYSPQVGTCFAVGFDLTSTIFFVIAMPMDVLSTLIVWLGWWYTIFPLIVQNMGLVPLTAHRGHYRIVQGVTNSWDFPKLTNITIGMFFGIGIFFLFQGRDTFTRIWKVFRGRREFDDPVISYKISVIGYIICFVALYAMMVAVGSWWFSIVMLIWMQIMSVAAFRVRGELWYRSGAADWPPVGYQLLQLGPLQHLNQTPQTFTTYWVYDNFAYWVQIRDFSGHYVFRGIDAFKVQHDTGGSGKITMLALAVATLVGFPLAQTVNTMWVYAGENTVGIGGGPGLSINNYTIGPGFGGIEYMFLPPMYPYPLGVVLGFVLMFVRARFAWFPLNPVAMASLTAFWNPQGPWLYGVIIPAYVIKYFTFRLGGDRVIGMIMKVGIGFLAGYFLKEIISFIIGISIGIPNIPPPA